MEKLGRFSVSRELFMDLNLCEGINLFHGMTVLHAEHNFSGSYTDYFAVHEDFEEVMEDCETPKYKAEFNNDSIYPKWVRI